MKIFYSKHLPTKGFSAINIFEFVIIRSEYKEILNERLLMRDRSINHEQILTAQKKELFYIFLYLWCGLEWLILRFSYGLKSKKAYENVSFEKEAYKNDENFFI